MQACRSIEEQGILLGIQGVLLLPTANSSVALLLQGIEKIVSNKLFINMPQFWLMKIC